MWKFNKKKSITVAKFQCKREHCTIRGTEYRPAGEHLPIAVVSHGFMAYQDTVRQYAKKLAELGYVSYCFDFCGGSVIKGKSSGKTTEMSVLTEVKDLEAVIQYAKSKPYSDPGRIVLMGCSQGGLVSALTAAKHSSLISKLILFYPAFCIPYDARRGKMLMAEFDPNHIPDRLRCGPMKLGRCYVQDVIGMDPYLETKGFHGDVLIVHGTRDRIVGLKYVKKAYAAYKKETKEKQLDRKVAFRIVKNGKHGFSKKCDRIAVGYMERFLK
ncbi:MAG: alpha/beta hydrolase [Eubacterium sp.]|nr:alpha/beta hydrolase [Eubacterium sp.]